MSYTLASVIGYTLEPAVAASILFGILSPFFGMLIKRHSVFIRLTFFSLLRFVSLGLRALFVAEFPNSMNLLISTTLLTAAGYIVIVVLSLTIVQIGFGIPGTSHLGILVKIIQLALIISIPVNIAGLVPNNLAKNPLSNVAIFVYGSLTILTALGLIGNAVMVTITPIPMLRRICLFCLGFLMALRTVSAVYLYWTPYSLTELEWYLLVTLPEWLSLIIFLIPEMTAYVIHTELEAMKSSFMGRMKVVPNASPKSVQGNIV